MRLLVLVLFLLGPISPTLARRGVVETRDGRSYEGHIRFESNMVVVADAARELWEKIGLTNLAGMSLEPIPVSAVAPGGSEDQTTKLPRPWRSLDVGAVLQGGSAEFKSGMFRVKSSGTNIMADGDSFHFVYKQVRSNSQVVARVMRVSLTDHWARAGVMMRETLAADARNVSLAVTAARGGLFSVRDRIGGQTMPSLDLTMRGATWLKIKRDGDLFTALKSSNGRQWWTVEKVTMPMAQDIYVGLTAVGVREGVLNESLFEEVDEAPSLRNRWFEPQVELRSGSMQSGWVVSMDDTAVQFEARQGKQPVARHGVANVRFQPVPSRLAPLLSTGRPGALLSNGEFIEGDCRGIEEGLVTISSVPLGLLRYDVNNEVIAVVLTKRAPWGRQRFEVTTASGARWLALEVALDREGLTIREPLLGLRRIPAHDVVELRRNG